MTTDDQARRFSEWQDGLIIDILGQSFPAIVENLASCYCRNHRSGLDPASFPGTLCVALLRRICDCAARGFWPSMALTPEPMIATPAGRLPATASIKRTMSDPVFPPWPVTMRPPSPGRMRYMAK